MMASRWSVTGIECLFFLCNICLLPFHMFMSEIVSLLLARGNPGLRGTCRACTCLSTVQAAVGKVTRVLSLDSWIIKGYEDLLNEVN